MRVTTLVLLAVVGAGCGDEIFINERGWKRVGGELSPTASGCMNATDLDGRAAKFTPRPEGASDYGTFTTTGDGAVHVVIHSQGEILATRRYDGAFLRSHRVDEFTVTTKGGVEYLLRYWGGDCAPLDVTTP